MQLIDANACRTGNSFFIQKISCGTMCVIKISHQCVKLLCTISIYIQVINIIRVPDGNGCDEIVVVCACASF